MNKAHFDILSALIKLNKEFTYNDAQNYLKSNIEVYDHQEFMSEYLPFVLNSFFEKTGPNDTDVKYKITEFGDNAYIIEKAKRDEIKTNETLQHLLNKSQLATNIFIGLTFIVSIFSLFSQFYLVRIEIRKEKKEQIKSQVDLLKLQQERLQDSIIILHSQQIESLSIYSLKKEVTGK